MLNLIITLRFDSITIFKILMKHTNKYVQRYFCTFFNFIIFFLNLNIYFMFNTDSTNPTSDSQKKTKQIYQSSQNSMPAVSINGSGAGG